MKKINLILSLLTFLVPSVGYMQNVTFDDGTTWNCDQNFSPVALRYQYQYRFFDTWNNPANVPAYMNTYGVRYKNSTYLSVGQTWPNGKGNVYWTDALRANGYAVPAHSSAEILSTYTNDWAILNHPTTRTGNDFMVAYQIGYDYSNNYPDASDDISHVECQPYYVTWCGDGVVDVGYETCDPADPAKTGWGAGGCDSSCKPVATPPTTPICDPARTGVQTSPLTQGYCQTGTPSGFVKTGTNPENYTWSCNAGGNSVNCSANYSTPTASLTIKKYAKDLGTGDTQTAPISVATGETFNYYYVLENPSSIEATKVVVKDTFPQYLTFAGPVAVKNPEGVDVTSDWSCVQGSKVFSPETNARVTLICDKKTPLPANSGKYVFAIPVTLSNTTPIGVNMQNVAYACADNLATNPK